MLSIYHVQIRRLDINEARTIITRNPVHGSVEGVCNDLTSSLRTQPRSIGVVVHEGDVERGLVCDVEVVLRTDRLLSKY